MDEQMKQFFEPWELKMLDMIEEAENNKRKKQYKKDDNEDMTD